MADQPKSGGSNQKTNGDDTKPVKEPTLSPSQPKKTSDNSDGNKHESEGSKRPLFERVRDWRNDPYRAKTSWTDKAIVLLTIGIVALAGMQWKEMDEAGKQTEKIIAAARLIESHQNQIVLDNKQTLIDNRKALDDSLRENRTELGTALKQNQAAINANMDQGKRALDASIAASRLDQRPWVVPSHFQLSAEPTLNVPITITVWVINTGKTPAINLVPQSRPFSWPGPPPPLDIGLQPAQTPSRGMLSPGITDLQFHSDPLIFTTDPQLTAYNNGINRIYLQGIIRYRDSFTGGAAHWTSLCIVHTHGAPLTEFNYCEHGNDIDHEQSQ